MKRITVLLADDHTVVRQGLRTLLSAEPDLEVVAEAENGRQAVDLAGRFRPQVVIMDIAMPVLNGLEATRQITRSLPSTKVLMLSSYANEEYLAALHQTGAAGYLLKHTAPPSCFAPFAKPAAATPPPASVPPSPNGSATQPLSKAPAPPARKAPDS